VSVVSGNTKVEKTFVTDPISPTAILSGCKILIQRNQGKYTKTCGEERQKITDIQDRSATIPATRKPTMTNKPQQPQTIDIVHGLCSETHLISRSRGRFESAHDGRNSDREEEKKGGKEVKRT
jgi:hypothetical protein